MYAFLDFEASSLAADSYPIEVAWVFEDGRQESCLIRPAPGWTDWDPAAEAIHGLTRERLLADGEPHDAVARRILEALSPHEVFVSAPSWDGKWLSVLLRAAGLPRHAMRLKDCEEALARAARAGLGATASEETVADLIVHARLSCAQTPSHRALADALQERRLWLAVIRLAREATPFVQGGDKA